MKSISAQGLAKWQSEGKAIQLLDVRKAQALAASGVGIAHAQWKDPAQWLDWKDQVPNDLPVVLYCAHGHEIGQGLTAALSAMGLDACYMEGGLSAWQEQGLPVQPLAVVTP